MEYPVFIKRGDARAEVDALVKEFESGRGSPEEAGLHRLLHVTKAGQTVVMVTRRDAPLAEALRGRSGWEEPREEG